MDGCFQLDGTGWFNKVILNIKKHSDLLKTWHVLYFNLWGIGPIPGPAHSSVSSTLPLFPSPVAKAIETSSLSSLSSPPGIRSMVWMAAWRRVGSRTGCREWPSKWWRYWYRSLGAVPQSSSFSVNSWFSQSMLTHSILRIPSHVFSSSHIRVSISLCNWKCSSFL